MPTAIAHAVVGGSLTLFSPKQVPRTRLALVLALLSVLPDFDVIAFSLGISYSNPLGHRGLTHSIPFAAILAPLATSFVFRDIPNFSKTWWSICALAFLATVSHGVLDAFTDAGLGVGFFIPFENSRYFFPWRPIATSPLSIAAFLNGPAFHILGSELIWVGIPLVVILPIAWVIKAFLRRRTLE